MRRRRSVREEGTRYLTKVGFEKAPKEEGGGERGESPLVDPTRPKRGEGESLGWLLGRKGQPAAASSSGGGKTQVPTTVGLRLLARSIDWQLFFFFLIPPFLIWQYKHLTTFHETKTFSSCLHKSNVDCSTTFREMEKESAFSLSLWFFPPSLRRRRQRPPSFHAKVAKFL